MAIIKPEQLSRGTYSISGSFSGSFHGDGSDLNNLPSNVISTGSYADFPDTGSEGYIYIDNSANIGYLWDSGSIPPTYVNIAGPSTPPDVLPLTFANAATVLALSPSPLYNNGISGSGAVLTGSINGVLSDNTNPGKIDYIYTPVVGDVILVKNQPTGSQNGLYTITSTGSVSSKYVLTRTDEYDVSSELFPLQVNILAGTNGANKSFIQSTANPVIGTSSLVFSAASPSVSFSPQIAFIDTVIDTPLTNIIYATGSFSSVVPGRGATITSTVPGTLGTWNGLSVNTNSNITGSFTRVLVINQTNPAHNGDYSVITTGSAAVFWQLQRINNNASGFDRYTRFFLVSNTSSSKAGRMYFTRPNSPVLTNATIGTAPINIFEYGGGGSSTPAFPFTGSALITGSLGVTGSIYSRINVLGSSLWQTHFAGERFDSTNLQGRIYIKTNYPSTATEDFYIGKNSGSADTNASTNGGIYYSHNGVFTVRNTSTAGFYGITLDANQNLTQRVGIDTGRDNFGLGWSLRNFTNSTDYINFAHNSGRVGIGWNDKTTSLLNAILDVRAPGSGSTDTVFRITNAANTSSILSIAGNGAFTYNANTGSITFIEGSAAGVGQRFILQRSTYSASFTIGNNGGTTLATDGLNITSNGSAIELNGGTSGGSYQQSVDLKGNSNLIARINSSGQFAFTTSSVWQEGTGGITYGDKIIVDGQTMAFRSASVAPTSTLDTFKLYSADVVAGNAAPHFRTEAGNIVKLYTQAAVTSSQGIADALTNLGLLTGSSVIIATATSGPFGIANSSGSYTYYSTLSASMAAASSGQTIEVFADYSGSSLIPPVILKNGVNINGNGHTYIGSLNSGSSLFQTGDGTIVSCSIINYNVTIAQTATGSCLLLGTNTSGIITLTGTVLKATGSLTSNCMGNWGGANSNFEIIDFVGFCSTSQPCISWGSSPSGKLRNAYASATTGSGYIGNVRVDNSIFTSVSGIGLYNSGGIVSDSIGISAGSYGIQSIGGFLNNSKGYSSGGVGIYVLYSNAYNCFGYSTSTYGMQFDNEPCRGYNCFGYSTANNGIRMYRFGIGADVEIYNSTAISTAATAFYWEGFASNMTCISEYNNVNGHAAEGANNAIIANSTLNVKHTGSNCLFKSTPVTQKYTQCTFKTATTPVNANITQGMINTQDNQGNIII
jgi:hypothetical protein